MWLSSVSRIFPEANSAPILIKTEFMFAVRRSSDSPTRSGNFLTWKIPRRRLSVARKKLGAKARKFDNEMCRDAVWLPRWSRSVKLRLRVQETAEQPVAASQDEWRKLILDGRFRKLILTRIFTEQFRRAAGLHGIIKSWLKFIYLTAGNNWPKRLRGFPWKFIGTWWRIFRDAFS